MGELQVDLVVLGGGISGLGIATEAVRRGVRTALIERAQVGTGTSAHSLRIIHGGFRYLQQMNLVRVVESIRDQARLRRQYPAFFEDLPCLMPLKPWSMKSRAPLTVAGVLYAGLRFMSGVDPLPTKIFSAHDSPCPILHPHAGHGTFLWHDLLLREPLAFARTLADEFVAAGGILIEGDAACGVERGERGFLTTTERGQCVESLSVVNGLGAWRDQVALSRSANSRRQQWCRAFNIQIARQLDAHFAFGIQGQGRLFFVVPRGTGSVIGTHYLPFAGQVDDVAVSAEECEEFLDAFVRAMPGCGVTSSDIVGIDLGVLPIDDIDRRGEPKLQGRWSLTTQDGYFELTSTKYTTFYSQGVEVVRRVEQYLHGRKR